MHLHLPVQSGTDCMSQLSSYAFITSTHTHADMQRAWHPLRPFQKQGKLVGSKHIPTAHHGYTHKILRFRNCAACKRTLSTLGGLTMTW